MTCRPRQIALEIPTPNPIFKLIELLLLYLSLELFVQKYRITTSLLLFWCPYMVINVVSVQQWNGGFLPDIIRLTLCDSIGEPF